MTEKQMLDLFMSLTERTIPCGSEHLLRGFFPDDAIEDIYGNLFVTIGESRTAFTSHLDTVGGKDVLPVSRIITGSFVHTDKKTILGADDKAGVAIMLGMIEDRVPGKYCFFTGEECGAIGSNGAKADGSITDVDFMISLDRAGYGDLIDTQGGRSGTSKAFEASLLAELERQGMFYRATGGVFTDSLTFFGQIPECTNLSVGYFGHHTNSESQNWLFLHRLYLALCGIDYGRLVAARTPVEDRYEDDYYGYRWGGYGGKSYKKWDDDKWLDGWDTNLLSLADTSTKAQYKKRYKSVTYYSDIALDKKEVWRVSPLFADEIPINIIIDSGNPLSKVITVPLGELVHDSKWSSMEGCWVYERDGRECLLLNGSCLYESEESWLTAIEVLELIGEKDIVALATDFDDVTDTLSVDCLSGDDVYDTMQMVYEDIVDPSELPADTGRLQEMAVAVRISPDGGIIWVVGSPWHYTIEEASNAC